MAKAKAPAEGRQQVENAKAEGRRQQLRRRGHHRPRGPRGGSQAPRDVHRLDRSARPPPPRLRGRRQLRRRGDRRARRPRHGHAASRQRVHRDRQRPRDPGRDAQEGEEAGRRGRADDASRRRQVRRRRRLQGLRRPPRRRRLGRQRALRPPPPRGSPRRPRLDPGLLARQADVGLQEGRRGEEDRDEDHLPPRPRDLRGGRDRFDFHDARRAPARDGLPDPRSEDRPDRRARRRARRPTSTTRAGSSTSSPT